MLTALLTALRALVVAAAAAAQDRPPTLFEISVPSAVRAEPITGRVYVMITRNREREPRLQLNPTGIIPATPQ